MEDNNNIEDWYRDELSKYHVDPPKNGWQPLSDELDLNTPLTDDNIIEWYKKEANKLEEKPDYIVWEKISTKLDTSNVWDKLATSLARYERFIWWKNFTLKGSTILILLFGSYLLYNDVISNHVLITNQKTYSNNNNFKENNTPFSNKEKSNHNETNSKKNVLDKRSIFNKLTIAKKNAPNYNPSKNSNTKRNSKLSFTKTLKKLSNSKTTAINKKKENNQFLNKTLLASKNTPKINLLKTKNINTITNQKNSDINRKKRKLPLKDIKILNNNEFLVKKSKNKIIFNNKRFSTHFAFGIYARRIYTGLNISVKKQALITSSIRNSTLSKYDQNRLLDFGHNIGATVGLIASDRFNFEANINFNSTGGDKRKFHLGEKTLEEDLSLNYATLGLLAKRMANKSTFDNKKYSSNFIGGIYGGYLTSNINDFKKTDFGIILGFEQDRYITKSFIITPGIRYNQGLLNISNESNDYRNSRSFSLEFNLGIKYIFLKRG